MKSHLLVLVVAAVLAGCATTGHRQGARWCSTASAACLL